MKLISISPLEWASIMLRTDSILVAEEIINRISLSLEKYYRMDKSLKSNRCRLRKPTSL